VPKRVSHKFLRNWTLQARSKDCGVVARNKFHGAYSIYLMPIVLFHLFARYSPSEAIRCVPEKLWLAIPFAHGVRT
jgi:hypothetical protein